MNKLMLLLIILLFFTGCNRLEYFTEYVDVNLIADYPLSHPGWTPNTTTIYLNFEAVTVIEAGTDEGLPAGAEWDSYRLEIPNLFGNGDFLAGTAGWTLFDGNLGTPPEVNWIEIPNNKAITDGTLQYTVNDNLDRIEYALPALPAGHYSLAFDFKKEQADVVSFAIREAGIETVNWQINNFIADDVKQSFREIVSDPTFSLISATPAARFTLNSEIYPAVHGNSALDNIRLIRLDVTQGITIDLPYQVSTALPFVSGTYVFSVYVKKEDASQVTPDIGNRFQGPGLSLSLQGIQDTLDEETGTHTYTVTSAVSALFPGNADWSTWQQVSLEGMVQVAEQVTAGAVTARLIIAPLNEDSGSLLIACPGLVLQP